jgi:hypothetical protein
MKQISLSKQGTVARGLRVSEGRSILPEEDPMVATAERAGM